MSFIENGIFPVIITLVSFRLGQWIQHKGKSPVLNPILLGAIFTGCFLLISGIEAASYQTGNQLISWLMTPATVALAIPMYEQYQILKKSWKAVLLGVAAGTVTCLLLVLLGCILVGMEAVLTISLLPKSVTSAIGVSLSELFGGLGGVTTAAIIISGILANILGTALCRILKISDPIAQGVAFGTSGHVIATARANELGSLTGAVSSLSLVVAGLLTAVLMPMLVKFV